MGEQTADSLLNLLSLFGFVESGEIVTALAEACQDEECKEIVQLLADNLKLEDIPAAQAEPLYQPTEAEQAVAKGLAGSHGDLIMAGIVSQTDLQLKGRNTTAAMLTSASKHLEKDLQKEIALTTAGIEAARQKIEDLCLQAEAEVARACKEVTALEGTLNSLAVSMCGSSEAGSLLCLQDLEQVKSLDQELLHSLRKYWRAQISGLKARDDIPQVDGSGKLSAASQRLLCGEEGEIMASRAAEVDRIRQAYNAVLEGNIRMKALQAKQDATLQALKGGLSRPELASQDAAFLLGETKSQQKQLEALLDRKQKLLTEDLPKLSTSIASLQCLNIIKGQLEVELHRNNFYSTRKREVSDLAVARASRNAALFTEARHEADILQAASSALKSLGLQVTGINNATDIRTEKHAAEEVLSHREPALPTSATKTPTPSSIADKQHSVDALLHCLANDTIPKLLASSSDLHSYTFSSIDFTSASLSSSDLAAKRKELEDAQMELGIATDQVYQQQESCNSILRTGADKVNAEREVFPKFFTKPQALLKDMKQLQSSVKGKAPQSTPRRTPRPKRALPGPSFR